MFKLAGLASPAKINLFLRVTGKRADGYHELDTIFLPISLFDRVTVEMRSAASRSITLRSTSHGIPLDGRNLAVRAAGGFLQEFGINSAVAIELDKQIPVGAGMGGGSSDAGAVLRLMSLLYRVEDAGRLAALALSIGADVPFFLDPKPARVRGVGDLIEPLKRVPTMAFVIGVPAIEVSTAEVFSHLRMPQWSGAASQTDIASIEQGKVSAELVVNDLAQAASGLHPEIEALKVLLQQTGASAVAMTGSGGAVFGLYPDSDEAEAARVDLTEKMPATRFLCASSTAASVDSKKARQ
jgi:4-diphosphocytidyl-2-C-methyl-D-erythritol kinase